MFEVANCDIKLFCNWKSQITISNLCLRSQIASLNVPDVITICDDIPNNIAGERRKHKGVFVCGAIFAPQDLIVPAFLQDHNL